MPTSNERVAKGVVPRHSAMLARSCESSGSLGNSSAAASSASDSSQGAAAFSALVDSDTAGMEESTRPTWMALRAMSLGAASDARKPPRIDAAMHDTVSSSAAWLGSTSASRIAAANFFIISE